MTKGSIELRIAVDVASLPRIQGAVRFVDVPSVAHCH